MNDLTWKVFHLVLPSSQFFRVVDITVKFFDMEFESGKGLKKLCILYSMKYT